ITRAFKAIKKNDNNIHTSSRRYDKIISFENTKCKKRSLSVYCFNTLFYGRFIERLLCILCTIVHISLVSSEIMNCKVLILVCLAVVQLSYALPFLFRIRNGQYDDNSRGRGGRSYNDIARVINPNPYGNIGSVPFPAQPFWTYG
ncbi:hypothetical protein Bhyg_10583, partial [Pseudolycoriella hygida]